MLLLLSACKDTPPKPSEYLLLKENSSGTGFSYGTPDGKEIIPAGKYQRCYTDTFRNYAIVYNQHRMVAIDRNETILYEVFMFDNGPDYPSEGLFRMIQNGKIGYADAENGQVVIPAQFDCAFPFENGKAKVSNACSTEKDGEYSLWTSNEWKYIDRTGKWINP